MDFSNNRGSTAVVIIVIFLAAIIMFIFPLMVMTGKQDDTANLQAQKIATEYVDKWRTQAKITQEDWDNLHLALGATGRSYNVEITVFVLDENQTKKTTDGGAPGSGVYYTLYTSQVEESLPLNLSEGCIVSLVITTTDESISDQLTGWAYKVTGTKNPNVVEASGMVTKNSN